MNDRHASTEDESSSGVSREDVRDFYSKAAIATQESLCCPVKYERVDLSHIPERVLEISYGCGSPVSKANIRSGETLVDLGSGGGIDCFIAAKIVGASGRVIGIDMTEKMLAVARENAQAVSQNLGYNNLEFKQGFLENIPLEDESVDVVTSNCVINLSTRKKDVFKDIHRILKPGGRFVIADIISDQPVPEEMRNNRELWGECVAGALTLDEFLGDSREAQFHGITVTQDYLWKEVEGIKFYSYILSGYKHNPPASCCAGTQLAIYKGPFATVTCRDTTFSVGVPVEIDTDMAETLSASPYEGMFNVIDPENEKIEAGDDSCCA